MDNRDQPNSNSATQYDAPSHTLASDYVLPLSPVQAQHNVLNIFDIFALVLRQAKWLALGCMIAVLLGFVYMNVTKPTYRSSALLLVDPRESAPIGVEGQNLPQNPDPFMVESQLVLIKSKPVLERVIRDLDLQNDPASQPGLLRTVLNMVKGVAGNKVDVSEEARVAKLARELSRSIKIKRPERTYTLEIQIKSNSPEMAIKLSNALIDAYFAEKRATSDRTFAARDDWVSERVALFGKRLAVAEQAIQDYRLSNGLLDTSTGPIAQQRVDDTAAELAVANAASNIAKARWSQISTLISSGRGYEALNRDIRSPLFDQLVSDLAALEQQRATISQTFGPRHPNFLSIQEEISTKVQQVANELRAIGASVRVAYESAIAVEDNVAAQLEELRDETFGINQISLKLRNLEREATAAQRNYEKYLSAQDNLRKDITEAPFVSVISPPSASTSPVSPKLIPTMIIALAAGLNLGIVIAVIVDFLSRYKASVSTYQRDEDVQVDDGYDEDGFAENDYEEEYAAEVFDEETFEPEVYEPEEPAEEDYAEDFEEERVASHAISQLAAHAAPVQEAYEHDDYQAEDDYAEDDHQAEGDYYEEARFDAETKAAYENIQQSRGDYAPETAQEEEYEDEYEDDSFDEDDFYAEEEYYEDEQEVEATSAYDDGDDLAEYGDAPRRFAPPPSRATPARPSLADRPERSPTRAEPPRQTGRSERAAPPIPRPQSVAAVAQYDEMPADGGSAAVRFATAYDDEDYEATLPYDDSESEEAYALALDEQEDAEDEAFILELPEFLGTRPSRDELDFGLDLISDQQEIGWQVHELQSVIAQSLYDHGEQTVFLTSSEERTGKTFAALMLARAAAEKGENICLFDANYGNPTLSHLGRLAGKPVLLEVGDAQLSAYRLMVPDTPGTIYVLPNVSDPLTALTQFVQPEFDQIDMFIVDGPSVEKLADTNMIAEMSEGFVLVENGSDYEEEHVQPLVDALGEQTRYMGVALSPA